MKRKITMLLIVCIVTGYGISQQKNYEFGSPFVVLLETDPWLMVIGSDVPTIAIYKSGNIIYKRAEKNNMEYYTVKLDSVEIQEIVSKLGITDDLIQQKKHIDVSDWTDQPTNELILNFDSVLVKTVYGDLRNGKENREKTPKDFLTVYDNLIKYKNKKEKKWLPDFIEVMLIDYSNSSEKPIVWPKNWVDLNSETTIKRSDMLYSLYIPKSDFDELLKLMSTLKEKQAFEINGRKFFVSYRLPFPNIR